MMNNKIQAKFLKNVVENLIDKQAVPIVDLLIGKKDVNEFLIAKKLGLTINQTRNILYKLSDYGLVSFIRKKDKKKGWYIYFWTLNVYQSLNLLEKKLREELLSLEEQLKSRREKRYYVCNTCSIEITEETALLNEFKCPECEEIYELADNQAVVKQLEKSISKIKKEMSLVLEEKEKEKEKIEKKKRRKIKSEEKKKIKTKKKVSKSNLKKKNLKKVKKVTKKRLKKESVKKRKK